MGCELYDKVIAIMIQCGVNEKKANDILQMLIHRVGVGVERLRMFHLNQLSSHLLGAVALHGDSQMMTEFVEQVERIR